MRVFTPFYLGVLLTATSAAAENSPAKLVRTEPVVVARGHSPALALDASGRMHLLTVEDDRLFYRTRVDSAWTEREAVASEAFYNYEARPFVYARDALQDCRVYAGADGVVRATITRGLWGGSWSFYLERRSDGLWSEPLRFPTGPIPLNRSINPQITVDAAGRVFAVSFATKTATNMLVRIDPSDAGPQLAVQVPLRFGMANTQVHWHPEAGLRVVGTRKGWHLGRHDSETLEPVEEPVPFALFPGEQIRTTQDPDGTLHIAGGHLWGKEQPGGFYQSSTRLAAGKEPIRFRQDMRHACGAVLPLRDQANPDRVWLVGWSGDKGNRHGEIMPMFDGANNYNFANHPENRLHVTVVEGDAVVLEHVLVDERPGSHGNAHRSTPAAVALPGGGVALAYSRWLEPSPENVQTYWLELQLKPGGQSEGAADSTAPMLSGPVANAGSAGEGG